MRAIITGGGTGGHIYPALAVAEKLKDKNTEILYLGSEHRMEAEIVPKAGYDFRELTLRPLARKLSFKLFSSIFYNTKAFFKSLQIIKEFKPDFVLGTGGFVAGPVVLAALILRKKTIIHEQNAYPGLANKILAKFVDKICLNFSEAEKYLNTDPQKIEVTGNPVRPQILNVNRKEAYQKLALNLNLKTILITGGSLGAKIINENVLEIYKYALKNKIQIIHLSGKKNYKQLLELLNKNNINFENDLINIISYLEKMEYALAAADLIISRAGATALAEITSSAKPSILIPFAAAAENHQLINAQALEKNGAALLIEEKNLSNNLLLKKVKSIIENEKKIREMSSSAAEMSQKDSLEKIIAVIDNLITEIN